MGTKVHVSRMFHGKLLGLRWIGVRPVKQVGQVVGFLHVKVGLPTAINNGWRVGFGVPDGPSVIQLAKFVAHGGWLTGEAIGVWPAGTIGFFETLETQVFVGLLRRYFELLLRHHENGKHPVL